MKLISLILFIPIHISINFCNSSSEIPEDRLPSSSPSNLTDMISKQSNEDVLKFMKTYEVPEPEVYLYIGNIYYTGEWGYKSFDKAMYWWKLAADENVLPALYNIGRAYEMGEGVDEDIEEAVSWYDRAARRGLACAQNNLGCCYAAGRGVPEKNLIIAFEWWKYAAKQGLSTAKVNLESGEKAGSDTIVHPDSESPEHEFFLESLSRDSFSKESTIVSEYSSISTRTLDNPEIPSVAPTCNQYAKNQSTIFIEADGIVPEPSLEKDCWCGFSFSWIS